jgi:hypothetical protein
MKVLSALAAVSALALAGCVSGGVAEEHAQAAAASQCAPGQTWVQTSGSVHEDPAVTAATAHGQCVDSANVPPPPPPQGQ